MKKYLLFSDLHLGIHSNDQIWLDASLKLADKLIEHSKSNKIEHILFGGDFFNDRRSINLKTLDTAVEFCNKFEENNLHLFLICGNHDTYLKNSLFPNSLKIFENYKHVLPVTKLTQIDEFITLIPWSTPFQDVTTPYMFGHFEINGFDVDRSESFEYSVKDFKRFIRVFSGHFHNPKISGNVEYIGSVMPFTMHDVDSSRGFYELEIESPTKFSEKFIEFTDSPKYKVIFSDQEIKEEDIKGNVVKLVYVNELSSVENENLMSKISEFGPVQINPDFKNVTPLEIVPEEQESMDPSKVKNALALFYEFLNKVNKPNYIKEETVKNFVKKLLQEN